MTAKKISRRDFIKMTGLTLGATALACSGITALGSRQPSITFSELSLGENEMSNQQPNNKILVAYASRSGSTGGVAEAIGKTLAEQGSPVDVLLMKDVKDLSSYQAVVLGSAICGAKWLPEAMQFVEARQRELASKQVAIFMVCITLAMPGGERYRDGIAGWMAPVRNLLRPVSEGAFAGTLDFSKMPLITEGLRMRALSTFTRTPEGDYRDWDAIRAWAGRLPFSMISKN